VSIQRGRERLSSTFEVNLREGSVDALLNETEGLFDRCSGIRRGEGKSRKRSKWHAFNEWMIGGACLL
jgi:hypothetical protein